MPSILGHDTLTLNFNIYRTKILPKVHDFMYINLEKKKNNKNESCMPL